MARITLTEKTRQELRQLLKALTVACNATEWDVITAASTDAVEAALKVFKISIWNYDRPKWKALCPAIRAILESNQKEVQIDPAAIIQSGNTTTHASPTDYF